MTEGRPGRRVYSIGERTIIAVPRVSKGGYLIDLLIVDKLPFRQPAQLKPQIKK